ncbi:serine/threonine-protein kinase [Bacillus mycoides]|uniref:serine/threonine-protein kinase n=1 Tax=Bacillus mycoides TaxID=1405 RepID=UPI003F75484B
MELTNRVTWKPIGRIGEPSGFGVVYAARRYVNGFEQEGDYVVKELSNLDEDSIARFQREVRYLTKLDHPRIIKCEDYGLENPPYFYVMRRYTTSLSTVLPELMGNFPRLKVIFNNVLEGLEYLHSEGYYHRDLKPANVLLNSDNDLVLCDLGLCINASSDDSTRLTRTHMGIGTRFYCSPEQEMDLKSVDHRTDIYSFGKMLYEAFTHSRPNILDLTVLPAAIQYVVKLCTREHRENRFDSVEELRQHFNRAMDILIDGASEDDLLIILDKINQFGELDFVVDGEAAINKLANALDNLKENEQLHETMMSIPAKAYELLFAQYPDLLKRLITEFVRTVDSQGWPFSYTDTLANKYYEIFKNTHDTDIHEDLLKSLLTLGASHNRWYVMGRFVDLLKLVKDESEAHSIYHALYDEDYYLKRVMSNVIIDKSTLHPIIGRLFFS